MNKSVTPAPEGDNVAAFCALSSEAVEIAGDILAA
jgi:hypothetical protein